MAFLLTALPGTAAAQSLLPPAQTSPPAAAPGPGSPGTSLTSPGGTAANPATAPAPAAPTPPAVQAGPPLATGQVALALTARYGRDPPAITSGLLWRVYADKDPTGGPRLVKEDRTAAPMFMLPPGGYIVHVTFGLAQVAKRVQLRGETVREVFEIPAGGARFEGRVGDARIPGTQISFDIYKGSQFEGGAEKRPLAEQVASGEVVLLPEGTYHVVSNYGDGNSVMRSDFRVQPAKLTDTLITHRAAKITLKLVSEKGGEALATTQWSVLTPGGDTIKETTGAFPVVILAEGDYVVVAKNEGKVFNREFKVEAGFDREIEVLAR
jgi:hypothetical protein